MPISVTTTAAPGTAYGDIRVGECQVHQSLLAAASLAASRDANGSLPVGLPVKVDGTPISAPGQTTFGLVGPESVKLGSVNIFGNVILSGNVNRDMIEDNLGRALTADEIASLPAAIRLI